MDTNYGSPAAEITEINLKIRRLQHVLGKSLATLEELKEAERICFDIHRMSCRILRWTEDEKQKEFYSRQQELDLN